MAKRDISNFILYDKSKRILMQYRKKDKKKPGYWNFFGGGIEKNETPEKAAKREAKEELTYKLKNQKLMMTQQYADGKTKGTQYIFMEEYDTKQKLVLKEGQAMGFYQISDLSSFNVKSYDMDVLNNIKGKY